MKTPTSARTPTADPPPARVAMIGRGIVSALAAFLLAVTVVRNAGVHALSEANPQRAAAIWAGHPDVQLSLGLIEIAQASRDRRPVPQSVFAGIDAAALNAPLAPEPFLVRGVQASLAGNNRQAELDFAAAQHRDPRSLPAAYFLADRYFRVNDVRHGLTQIAMLSRLAPGGTVSLAPHVAAYARDRANWPRMRALFRSEPRLGEVALQVLAGDPANTATILALAGPEQHGPAATWLRPLLSSLVGSSRYAEARAVWAGVSNARSTPGNLLFDPEFQDAGPPPPFNWELAASGLGLAERRPGGGLHLMFYGQDDGMLARQLLVLQPGSYRLTLRIQAGGSHSESLFWTVRCDKAGQELARVRMDQAARGWNFQVPAGCPAQWLDLTGSAPELPQPSDVTISNLVLTRGGPGA
ncbi:MAG: hypothetical protein ABIO80_01425 [Sphingomicrobium sp.]